MSCVKLPHVVSLLVLSGLCLVLFGCGGLSSSNPPSPTSSQPSVNTFSISPDRAVLTAGNSLQFAAPANRARHGDLNWLVNGVAGGNLTSGTISRSGLYMAPPAVTSNTVITVAAISATNPTEASSASLTVVPMPISITVSVSPSGASLHPSQTQQFTATVTGTTNKGIGWFVNGSQGGSSTVGTISAAGVYTAPLSATAVPSVTITAESTYDTASSATAAVAITAAPASTSPPSPTPPATTPPATATNTVWNPTVLGVPWASDFTAIAANQINVQTDPRLKVRAKGDGVTDDTTSIRAAIQLASSTGGGTVYFPSGNYKIITPSGPLSGTPLKIPSHVILQGASSTTSLIVINDPSSTSETDGTWTWGGIDFQGSSLSGMTDLGVTAVAVASSSSPCATIWNRGSTGVSELFFNNMNIELNNCRSFLV